MSSNEIVEKSWDLSLYELHRTPQEAITDNTEIAVSALSLKSELTCPICLDMLSSTMTTKECLHRFCADCIVTALRSGNKECPTCRKKLVSKRSLRPDPNFDQLVEKIFPNREEYEAQQESILETLSKSRSANFITSITDGIKAQMAHAKAIHRKKNLNDEFSAPSSAGDNCTPIGSERTSSSSSTTALSEDPVKKKKKAPGKASSSSTTTTVDSEEGSIKEIEIVFKPHPALDKNLASQDSAIRYIKTTSKALVEHLCKYLAMRISLDLPPDSTESKPGRSPSSGAGSGSNHNVSDLIIHICTGNATYVPLNGTLSLSEVNDRYWKVNKPMEMFYSFKQF
eukprot:TRINITY_DN6058_c0_g1_i1.p1 TRINITY_DN6058_c0_g1~~TRINITY_DN6058_c0_g1_i1.p1  ORF type:complete len:341 (-),score=105.25 TRINITY_DN6058_c0_g1_i1:501-1523(-)